MTNQDLERNWRNCVLKTSEVFGGISIPFTDKYSQCLGARGLGVAFQIIGMDGRSPDHFSILRVEADGKCYEQGTTGYGMYLGTLTFIDFDPESLAN